MFHVKHRMCGDYMNDIFFNIALDLAKKAYNDNEIPVGCVIVKNNEIIACGYNCKESKKDSTMHAEIVAIREACMKLGDWRLDDCIIYVTLKPCLMCIGAIVESRIKTVYYGTTVNSKQMYDNNKINKSVDMINLNSKEAAKLMSDFFKNKRK